MDTLNITVPVIFDKSIEELDVHEYETITGANLNQPEEIPISIEMQDIFTKPSDSYLIVEGQLTKADGMLTRMLMR